MYVIKKNNSEIQAAQHKTPFNYPKIKWTDLPTSKLISKPVIKKQSTIDRFDSFGDFCQQLIINMHHNTHWTAYNTSTVVTNWPA